MRVTCKTCNVEFDKLAYEVRRNRQHFCSPKCKHVSTRRRPQSFCSQCACPVQRKLSQMNRGRDGRVFCCRSCAVTYNNIHKTTGTRRSKLECWLEDELSRHFSHVPILFNDKTAIGSELDIFFPSINLAVELNGIYHYEAIHGPTKLSQIQNNDKRKYQACLEREIELLIIDTSGQKYFKPTSAQIFLDIIVRIVSRKMMESNH